MKNLTPEMIEKAKAAKSAEELLEIAKANNVEMTADEAATYFAQLSPKSGELDDDDLDSVAGGACKNNDANKEIVAPICPKCNALLKVDSLSRRNAGVTVYSCTACNAVFEAYLKDGLSVLHPVK